MNLKVLSIKSYVLCYLKNSILLMQRKYSFIYILSTLCIVLSTLNMNAQKDKVQNLPEFDERYLHFGFSLGVNAGDFFLQHHILPGDTLLGLETRRQPGFNINMLGELHFLRYCGVRFAPGICLTSRILDYKEKDRSGRLITKGKQVESTYVELPILLKFRSERLNNMAVYVIGGGQYSIDLASQANTDNSRNFGDEIVIKQKRHVYNGVIGGGMDFFMEFYKFSIEFKYAMGLQNTFIQDNTQYSRPIDVIKPRMFIFSISFEG